MTTLSGVLDVIALLDDVVVFAANVVFAADVVFDDDVVDFVVSPVAAVGTTVVGEAAAVVVFDVSPSLTESWMRGNDD